jgi:hypothetical protein
VPKPASAGAYRGSVAVAIDVVDPHGFTLSP